MYRNMNKDTDKNTRRGGVGGWFLAMARVFRREFSLVFSDLGIILFFFVLPLAYPVTYTLIYNPEIVTDLPVAVVDHSRTADSRALVQAASAAPSIQIYAQCADMAEAKELFASNKVFAIIEIPADYARKIGRGEQATVPRRKPSAALSRTAVVGHRPADETHTGNHRHTPRNHGRLGTGHRRGPARKLA